MSAILTSLCAFILFSLTASAIYTFNDILDINEDRQHPLKSSRPIANGQISIPSALLFIILLLLLSLPLATLISPHLGIILVIYLIMNIAYSMKLKHIPLIDVSIIASGFVLRLFAGASVSNVSLSMWIILITFLLALFLALAKRRDDVLLSQNGFEIRKNINGYNLEFINASMTLMASSVLVSYIFYTISPEVQERFHTHYLYLTVLFVIVGILRYFQITFVEERSGNPTKIALTDTFLQITILLWLTSFIILIYL